MLTKRRRAALPSTSNAKLQFGSAPSRRLVALALAAHMKASWNRTRSQTSPGRPRSHTSPTVCCTARLRANETRERLTYCFFSFLYSQQVLCIPMLNANFLSHWLASVLKATASHVQPRQLPQRLHRSWTTHLRLAR